MKDVILAIDYGTVRHGLAVSDALGMASHPLPALKRRSQNEDLAALRLIVEEREVKRLVVGLPVHMDGRESPMSVQARAFADFLANALGLPVMLEDERLSTEEAETVLRDAGLRPSERKKLRDSVAAAVILSSVLDREASEN
ncbi:MAG: Holliday junction resolvase RuvX [Planctomycetota bacterium]